MLKTEEIDKSQSKFNNSLNDSNIKKIEINNNIQSNLNTKKILLKDILNNNKEKKILVSNSKEKPTSKIDYRHYKSYPIKEIFPLQNLSNNNFDLYWLVTYDKLMKTKKILKILNNDIKSNGKPIYAENNLKVKFIKIDNFEIFFVKGFDKPFVRPKKDSFILAKLYLLSVKEITKIINYINKTKEKFTIKNIVNTDYTECENNYYELTDIKKNYKDENITYPYCHLYFVGKFMNISMLLVTNTFNQLKYQENNNNSLIFSLPSSRKLYKLIKLLIRSYPEYSSNYFLEYLIKRNLYKNYDEKKSEILKLLSLNNASVPNKFLLNKVLRETITGIQTNSSISGSSLHIDSDESSKCLNKIEIENQKRISFMKNNINNLLGFKNSLKSSNCLYLNGPIGSINYLSTNQTIRPCNSIKTLQNSFKNFIPTITIPNEINNARNQKDSFGVYLTGSTNMQNRLSCYLLQRKEKGIDTKKINNKKDKENIDINIILNKKKSDIFFGSKNESKNIINNNIVNKKKEKRNKINNSKIYHTPKKRKKIKYYK